MLEFPAKKLRALVIADYLHDAGYPGVVCFTCGNAATALRQVGVDVLEVGAKGVLIPGKWWTPAEVHKAWPHLFDATSGHLPLHMMDKIAVKFYEHFHGYAPGVQPIEVPTGSGETIVCLRLAFPKVRFVPVRNLGPATEYHPEAPLNAMVEAGNE